MLDQSFSAHNFEIIYSLESRKGNIDIKSMSPDYVSVIELIEEIKKEWSELKKSAEKTDDTLSKIVTLRNEIMQAKQEKHEVLQTYLSEIEKTVNGSSFKFHLRKFMPDDKEVFTLDNPTYAHFFASKQLQQNILHTFKVKQANRHNILSNIKTFLNSKIPVYVIRTDVSGFYESIPHDKLKPMILGNSMLSNKSKAFVNGILSEYERIKDTNLVPANQGIPRGIGISSYLSELYMRDIDRQISSRREVMFYARYVDDIFMIITSLPVKVTIDDYYADMTALFRDKGLTLKQKSDPDGKCKLLDLHSKDTLAPQPQPFDYVGYKISIKKDKGDIKACYSLSDNKQERYHDRIDNIITHFEYLSKYDVKQAYKDLFDSLNYITGNINLFKSKSGVKIGLYYNNDLLDNLEDLDNLTEYLHAKEIEPYSGLKDAASVKDIIHKKVLRIDFRKRWQERKMYKFSLKRVQEIQQWL